ncbi:MAG: hypothetical protein IJX65_03365 [Alistipes sp.]|nr:hypothetical protein [Alistipes sp.]
MGRKFAILILSLFAAGTLSAQQLFFDGELSTHFDNTEYTGSGLGDSRTIFAVRVAPTLGYRFEGNHSVVLGADLLKDFGSSSFIDATKLIAYYQYTDNRWGANAGIFQRDKLVGSYSRAFFSDAYLIYNPLIQGVTGRYTGKNSFAEIAVDWEGLYATDTREKFRVLLAGGGEFADICYAGAAFSMLHFANQSTFQGNVVDNLLLNPYIGVRFNAFFDFDIRLGALVSAQRDRRTDSGWDIPAGGELYLRFSRWGAYIENNLYVGAGLTPYYNTVGKEGLPYADNLYACDPFYGTQHKLYNRTGIGYSRSFAGDRVAVKAEMVLQCDGQKLYCQQLVGISAKICPVLYDKRNHKK